MFPSAAAAPGTTQPPGNAPSAPNVQVLTIPQLDAIQRTQKVLDSRLTVLQQQTEAINISDGLPASLPLILTVSVHIHFSQHIARTDLSLQSACVCMHA